MSQVGIATQTKTIPNGTALSDAFSPGAGVVVAVIIPASWTTADLTFKGSVDGVTFANVFEGTGGTEVTAKALVGQYVTIPNGLRGCPWLIIRSGTSGSAVNQGATRSLTIVIEKLPT